MRVLVDGYNVTKRDPATRDLSLEDQRHALEVRLKAKSRALLGTTDYLIVWDGAGGKGVVHGSSVKTTYTRMPTADDSIVKRVRSSKQRLTVVTSDNGLADRCRQAADFGVDIKPSSILFESADAHALKKKGTRKKARMTRDVGIPAEANKINEELKKLWGIED